MDKNTFYYALSTMPQVIAAISAILAVFLFRRLETLKNILLGDGSAILNRSHAGEYNFIFEDDVEASKERKTQDLRLRDGINRKDLEEIKRVVQFYSNQEKKVEENGVRINKKSGLQNFYMKFYNTDKLYNDIILFSKITFFVSVVSILSSVTCLSFADFIFLNCLSNSTLVINLIVFILSIAMTVLVVFKSFNEKRSA